MPKRTWEILKEAKIETSKGREIIVKRIKSDDIELVAINKDFKGVAFEVDLVKDIIKALEEMMNGESDK